MQMNYLHPEVAERPEGLVFYGGLGKAARNWEGFRGNRRPPPAGERGDPAGAVRQPGGGGLHPRRTMLVPHWATADEFRRLEGLGLTMYGQMTASSWIYIGTQGIL
jgi:urocanate hydratase